MNEQVKGPVLGCDIGNAYAYASVLERADADPTSLMPEKDGCKDAGMPTAAFVPLEPDAPIQVYDLRLGPPVRQMSRNPTQTVEAVKRSLSQNTLTIRGTGPTGASSRVIKPEDVYAAIVRDLVTMANATRKDLRLPPIYDLVFTYPVDFLGDTGVRERIASCIESVSLDGHKLHVVTSLPEPAAVALDYLYYVRNILPGAAESKREQLTVLVVDLGHGTLDLAVVTAKATDKPGEEPYLVHPYCPAASSLGGIDFDDVLEEHIQTLLRERGGSKKPFSPQQESKIRKEAKRVKHALSESERVELELDLLTEPVTVTRSEFEELSAGLLAQILERVEDQLRVAEENKVAIDRIILSGGGCHMPMIKRGIEALVQKKYPVESYRHGQAVSFGAARYGWDWTHRPPVPDPVPNPVPNPVPDPVPKPDPVGTSVLQQQANYSYGLRYEDPARHEYRVRYLIQYQSLLPATVEVPWSNTQLDLDLDIRRSKVSVKTGKEASLDDTADIVNKTFRGAPRGACTVTMKVDEEHNVEVVCRFEDGTVLRHGTGKYGDNTNQGGTRA